MKNPAFALLWISQAFSQLGTSMSALAYPLLILQFSGAALDAGLVGVVTATTALVLRIPGGLLADRYRYRAVMIFSDLTRAALLLALAATTLTGNFSLALVLLVVGLEVAFGVVFGPAEFALVRLVVPVADRALAVGRMQSRSHLAGLMGPVLGGVLYGIHPALPFLADATSYLVSLGCVLAVRTREVLVARGVAGRGRADFFAGLIWIRGQRQLFASGLWVAALTAVFAAVGLALVVFARDRGASSAEIGIMFAMSAAGGFAGALVTPALQKRFRPVAIFRTAAVIDTVATLALLPLSSPYLIGVAGAAAFFLAPAVSASLFGRLSATAPDAIVGRAQSAMTLLVGTVAPVTPAVLGAIVDTWGAAAGILWCAIAFAAITVVALVLPVFRLR